MVKQSGYKRRPADNYSKRGMDFENALNDMHQVYRAMGRGMVFKQYLPLRIVSHDSRGNLAQIIGRATVDFVGHVYGVPIAFDAKDVKGNTIPLSNLQPHQLQDMIDNVRCGGVAFVLVRFASRNVYRIPVQAWVIAKDAADGYGCDEYDGFKATGLSSIRESDIPKAWRIEGYDWADGITAMKG